MAASPRRYDFVDTNNQKIVAIVPMITHLKEAGPARTEIFFVGGNSVVVHGSTTDISAQLWT
ncbi:MAG TPA: hypothetical protein VGO17_09990 [Aurantimonas sp.]|jgi:hypothetical protein|nr:hypothetical protein [Aurantimonas sp.]